MSSVTSTLTIAALAAHDNAGFETDSVHAYSSPESSTTSTEVGGAEEKHRPYSSSSSDLYSSSESESESESESGIDSDYDSGTEALRDVAIAEAQAKLAEAQAKHAEAQAKLAEEEATLANIAEEEAKLAAAKLAAEEAQRVEEAVQVQAEGHLKRPKKKARTRYEMDDFHARYRPRPKCSTPGCGFDIWIFTKCCTCHHDDM